MTAPRELKLARRALRTAVTHLRAAQHLGTLAPDTRARIERLASALIADTQHAHALVAEAVLDLRATRKSRAA